MEKVIPIYILKKNTPTSFTYWGGGGYKKQEVGVGMGMAARKQFLIFDFYTSIKNINVTLLWS